MRIAGAVILITGASQGLGRRLAEGLAERGARILLAARNQEMLREASHAIHEAGGHCAYYHLDLHDTADIQAFARTLEENEQPIDILINNAADVTSKPLLETSLDEIEGLVHTNVTGALQLTRLILPGMVERGAGLIVNISSLAGYKANPTQSVYSITKRAVNGMSEVLRAELAGTGVHVMNVALSSVGDAPGQVPVARYVRLLSHAIERNTPELFLSPVSKVLMRLYAFLPGLMRLRGPRCQMPARPPEA